MLVGVVEEEDTDLLWSAPSIDPPIQPGAPAHTHQNTHTITRETFTRNTYRITHSSFVRVHTSNVATLYVYMYVQAHTQLSTQ